MSDVKLKIMVNGKMQALITNPSQFVQTKNEAVNSIKQYADAGGYDMDKDNISFEIDLGDGFYITIGKLSKSLLTKWGT